MSPERLSKTGRILKRNAVKNIKPGRLGWAGHVNKMNDCEHGKILTFDKPEGRRG
jgi:hypothetical protein